MRSASLLERNVPEGLLHLHAYWDRWKAHDDSEASLDEEDGLSSESDDSSE